MNGFRPASQGHRLRFFRSPGRSPGCRRPCPRPRSCAWGRAGQSGACPDRCRQTQWSQASPCTGQVGAEISQAHRRVFPPGMPVGCPRCTGSAAGHPFHSLDRKRSMSHRPLRLERWQSLSPAQQSAVRAIQISADQVECAGSVDRAIAACASAAPDEVAGLAVLEGGEVVGFVVLSQGAKCPDWAPPGSVALTAMRVDSSRQGQGIGKSALALSEAWLRMHWPEAAVLALCVDDSNHAGRRAYAAAGFSPYAAPKQGRIDVVHYLSKSLGTAPSTASPETPRQ